MLEVKTLSKCIPSGAVSPKIQVTTKLYKTSTNP